MLALTSSGNRRPWAAVGTCDGWLTTRLAGHGMRSSSRISSWAAFEISIVYALLPLTTGTPIRSRWRSHCSVWNVTWRRPRVYDDGLARLNTRAYGAVRSDGS